MNGMWAVLSFEQKNASTSSATYDSCFDKLSKLRFMIRKTQQTTIKQLL